MAPISSQDYQRKIAIKEFLIQKQHFKKNDMFHALAYKK